jgi:hypothetical protein
MKRNYKPTKSDVIVSLSLLQLLVSKLRIQYTPSISRLGQRYDLQNTTLTSYFYKKYL